MLSSVGLCCFHICIFCEHKVLAEDAAVSGRGYRPTEAHADCLAIVAVLAKNTLHMSRVLKYKNRQREGFFFHYRPFESYTPRAYT